MKGLIKHLLIGLLLVSLVLPFVPYPAASSSLTQHEMSLITGGKLALDCGSVAALAQAFCYLCGGSDFTCSTVYTTTYIACVLSTFLF